MNYQLAFDRALHGVLAQGGPSIDFVGRCAYRGADGRKCGVGHLIPDEKYQPYIEGDSADWPRVTARLADDLGVGLVSSAATRSFLQQLQHAHDNTQHHPENFIGRFKANMKSLADRHGLEYKE